MRRRVAIGVVVGLVSGLIVAWFLAGIFHEHHVPPRLHSRARCALEQLETLDDPTVEWRSRRTPDLERFATLDACHFVDIRIDAPAATVRTAVDTWHWQRMPCWPPPWEPDPGAAGHERARATYVEAQRRADFLEIATSHDGPIADVAVPILLRFQEEADGDPRWDPEIIALEIARWQRDSGESIDVANARYEHKADLLGVPTGCGLDVTHVHSVREEPDYTVLVSSVHGEEGLREVLGYLCGVGATTMSVVCQ